MAVTTDRLPPFRPWQVLWRSVFGIGIDGARHVVDIDHWEDRATLYVDGARIAGASMPAEFETSAGTIEVRSTTFGVRRVHLVGPDGSERQLHPAPGTAEAWRAGLARDRPVLSRAIDVTAIVVLLTGLVAGLPSMLELVTSIDVIGDRVGVFTSPLELPSQLVTTLTIAGVLAAVERALRLRNHWLIDMDTYWWD